MEDVMTEWKADMVRMSEFENVVLKLSLAMPVNGFNWHTRECRRPQRKLLMFIVNIIYTRSMLLGLQDVCSREFSRRQALFVLFDILERDEEDRFRIFRRRTA